MKIISLLRPAFLSSEVADQGDAFYCRPGREARPVVDVIGNNLYSLGELHSIQEVVQDASGNENRTESNTAT